MLKSKWLQPFVPTIAFGFQPLPDPYSRVGIVVGVLVVVGVLLGIIQPWREDQVTRRG